MNPPVSSPLPATDEVVKWIAERDAKALDVIVADLTANVEWFGRAKDLTRLAQIESLCVEARRRLTRLEALREAVPSAYRGAI